MKRALPQPQLSFVIPMFSLVVWLLPALCSAEPSSSAPTESGPVTEFGGTLGLTLRTIDGENESAKYEEYRDVQEPISGEAFLSFERKENFLVEFEGRDIAEQDQFLGLFGNWYGKLKVNLTYDEIPHRYAYNAETLYRGSGSSRLQVDDAVQADLQATSFEDRATRLQSAFADAAKEDLETFREKAQADIHLVAFHPFTFRMEVGREDRNGTKPFAGALGLNNNAGMVELAQPVNYDTTEMKLLGEYAKRPFLLNFSYYLSRFRNQDDALTWDNPFRITDSTRGAGGADGPSKALTDLAPDNTYHSLSADGVAMDLPFRSQFSASASWGWMKQDDALVPYTTNTAITEGATVGSPFDAFDTGNLPDQHPNAQVETSNYNFTFTSKPVNPLRVKAQFKRYEYDNETDEILFPGYVRVDSIWVDKPVKNVPTSYKKTSAGGEVGIDVLKNARLNLGYTYEKKRRRNREVLRQDDHVLGGSFDVKALDWLDLRLSYHRTDRDINNYNADAPLDAYYEGNLPREEQLPSLRKYDEADMTRDRVQFLATVYPVESLAMSGSYTYGRDDFDDSSFGLLEDEHYIASLDADFAPSERFSVFAFYSRENYKNKQKASLVPFDVSSSIWRADNEDVIDTFGGGFKVLLVPRTLDLEVSYSYSKVDGEIALKNQATDPSDFGTVDETTYHVLDSKLNYRFLKNFVLTLGYAWEKFDYDDFNTEGFTNIPVDDTGVYNGALLMGTLPEDYDVNVFYTKLTYRF